MTPGVLLACATALAFGISDGLAALSARSVGTVRTTAGSLLVSVTILTAAAFVMRLELPSDPVRLARVGALGILHGLAYFAFVRAMELGPVSVVSPITASSGVVTVILAIGLLGEHPSPIQLAAVPVTGLGCVLAVFGTGPGSGRHRYGLGFGPLFAFGTCLLYAVYTIGLVWAIESIGWGQAVLVSRAASVAVALAVIGWTLRRGHRAVRPADEEQFPIEVDSGPAIGPRMVRFRERLRSRVPRRRSALLIGVIGSLAAVGQITRAYALQTTPAWLIGLVAATSPVIVLVVALVVLRERMSRTQWIGVVMVMVGVMLVSVG